MGVLKEAGRSFKVIHSRSSQDHITLNGVKWDNKSHNQGGTEPCGVSACLSQ